MTDQHNSSQTTERRKKKLKNGGKWGQKITTAIFLPLMVKEAIEMRKTTKLSRHTGDKNQCVCVEHSSTTGPGLRQPANEK